MTYTPSMIRQNEKMSILNGAASVISTSFLSGFVPLFAISVLGASNQQIGLLSSLPPLMSMIAMIPGAILLNRLEAKRKFTAFSFLIARFFFLLILILPFLQVENRAMILVLTIALMNFPIAIATLSWQSFIGDLIPDKRRGQFFSERNRILTVVGMIVTFSSGAILNVFDKSNALPYQFLFLFAFLFGLLEVYFIMRHSEIKREKKTIKSKLSIKGSFSLIVKQKPYLTFLVCAVIFNFGWQMAWPLFTIYQINDAHASALWISLFTVANQISQIVSYKWWAKTADKWGNSVMLFVAGVGMATAPFLTILSKDLIYLTVINFWSGIFVAGTVMLLFNQLLHVSPAENRTAFLANYNIVLGAIGFIAPQIGVLLLETFNITIAMSISSVIRIIGGISFLLVVIYIERTSKKKLDQLTV